jgi:hypothetical protein
MIIHEKQIALLEDQTHHRMNLESVAIKGDNKRAWAGIICALIVCLAGFTLAYLIAAKGFPTLAGIIFTIDLGAIVGAFIYGTKSRQLERQGRFQQLADIQQEISKNK